MATPTTISLTYLTYTNASPTVISIATATVTIRPNEDFNNSMHNIALEGGAWIVNASGIEQWIPFAQIVSATAQ
jgi:hypothetical protein